LDKPQNSLTILLSHAHLDHIVGLTFLIDVLAVTPLKRIRLFGEAAKLDAVRDHLYHRLLFPVDPPMEFHALPSSSGSMEIDIDTEAPKSLGDTFKATWFPLEHPGGSLGYCIEYGGKKLAYITDTLARVDADYLKRVTGADLLLHECYFGNDNQELSKKTGHSWLDEVAGVVRATAPKQTALIHINPLAEILGNGFELSDQHRSELNMFVAEDEMQIDF
jgi:ribonuclease BN (tRNA processing enzyme)